MVTKRRPAVWEPRGETAAEVMPEWEVQWVGQTFGCVSGRIIGFATRIVPAPHAFDAWKQVHGAPAFGSCRVRRVESEPSFHDYSFSEDAYEREQVEAEIAKSKASKLAVQKT